MQPHEATGSTASAGLLSLYLSNCNQFIDNDGGVGLRQRSDPTIIGLITALRERENALREKNAAIAEKKGALTERENALMQRDVACVERDSAIMDRDRAVTALNVARAEREACPYCSSWVGQRAPKKFGQAINRAENAKFTEAIASIENAEMPQPVNTVVSQVDGTKKCKRSRKRKGTPKQENMEGSVKEKSAIVSGTSLTSKKAKSSQPENKKLSEESKFQIVFRNKDDVGDQVLLDGSVYDHSTIPSPYCSCTGMNQQCYRWGTGGWQSACCTNQISMHPLPMNPKKKSCRVAGRKMSAGAFGRLLERLVGEGWDISTPVDLKDYWSKHGTNRYVTIK